MVNQILKGVRGEFLGAGRAKAAVIDAAGDYILGTGNFVGVDFMME